MKITLLLSLLSLITFLLSSCMPSSPSGTKTYKTGTVWNYQTRSGEEYSRVHLSHKFRTKDYGTVYYVFIEHKEITGVYQGGLSVAVTSESLSKSLTEIISNMKAMDMIDGFEEWKDQFKHEGSIPYDETLAEILDQE